MSRQSFDANKKFGNNPNYTFREYTPESLVKDLIKLIPIKKSDFILDAGSGCNKVWFNNLPTEYKDEVELDEGKDFYHYTKQVDWVVGNPPYPEFIGFLFKAAEISRKGFAFLINHGRLNQLTPVRLKKLEEKGFKLNHIRIVTVRKWFGRYYFIVFARDDRQSIGFSSVNYSH